MSIPPRPPLAYLLTSDAHTPEEDIILVRSSAKNPIGSCFRGIAIQPGGLGYQTRAMVANWPSLHPYTPPPAPAQARPTLAPEPAPEAAPLADTQPQSPPDKARVLSAREAVAFIEQAAAPGEYEHLRADPRRSVKDAIADRDMDIRAAGVR